MKRLIATSILMLLLGLGAYAGNEGHGKKGSWNGWVSDAKCGAHLMPGCTKKCLDAGEKMVFVTDRDKSVIPVSNPELLKGHEGHHLKVSGSLADGKLMVASFSMLKDQTIK